MPGQIVNAAALAEVFGVTPATVSKWTTDGCPLADRGGTGPGKGRKYNTKDVSDWLIARVGLGSEKAADRAALQLRKLVAETETAELEHQLKIGAAVPIEAVAEVVGSQLDIVRGKLLALPTKIAPLVAPQTDMRKCQQIAEQLIHEALAELSGWATAEGQQQ